MDDYFRGLNFKPAAPSIDHAVIYQKMPLALVRAKVIGAAQVCILAAVEAAKRGQDEMPDPQEEARGGVHGRTACLRWSS